MKPNKYWFGTTLGVQGVGFLLPLSWEGWVITVIMALYFLCLFIFNKFFFEYPLIFIISIPVFIIPYFMIGFKKQDPKYKKNY